MVPDEQRYDQCHHACCLCLRPWPRIPWRAGVAVPLHGRISTIRGRNVSSPRHERHKLLPFGHGWWMQPHCFTFASCALQTPFFLAWLVHTSWPQHFVLGPCALWSMFGAPHAMCLPNSSRLSMVDAHPSWLHCINFALSALPIVLQLN